MRVGLRRISSDEWLVFDERTPAELAMRAALIEDHPETVMLESGFDDAAYELLDLVSHAAGHATLAAADGRSALVTSALLATEDQCLLASQNGEWRLVGGSLVFPNHWSLSDKIGGSLSVIHGPVEGYEEMLAARVVSFFDRMGTDSISMRRNWFVHDNDRYFLPKPKDGPIQIAAVDNASVNNAPVNNASVNRGLIAALTIRSERQTLRRLPRSGAVVFTIKTQMVSIRDAVSRPGFSSRLLEWALTATTRAQRLKGTAGCHDALIGFLQDAVSPTADVPGRLR